MIRKAKIGFVLIGLSGVLWFSLFAIPFLPLAMAQRATLIGIVFAAVQFSWWIGAALVGPETVSRIKSWFKRTKSANGQGSNPKE